MRMWRKNAPIFALMSGAFERVWNCRCSTFFLFRQGVCVMAKCCCGSKGKSAGMKKVIAKKKAAPKKKAR
jgi:hypothetical protein